MRLSLVTHFVGVILRVFGVALAAPLAIALLYREWHDGAGFAVAGAFSVVAGHLMRRASSDPGADLRRVEGLTIVAGTWLVVALVGAVPYVWAGLGVVDSLFESMSGFTTTGATTFDDFTRFGRAIFFWRGLTQWLGGMGVIALFVAVLPRLAIAGRQLFFAEAPGPTDEKLTPQIRKTAAVLWRLYTGLTVLEVMALWLAGMSLYDAVCHAFTTLAAGGFSPHPLSILGYQSPTIEWIITLFMFLAGANFALQYRALRTHPTVLLRDEEFRAYCGIVVIAGLLLTWFLWREEPNPLVALRVALFQVTSILTTTGYASVDFQTWDEQAKAVLLLLMFVGGCAGSAGGGPKVVRLLLIVKYMLLELKRTLHPRAVLPVKLGGNVVPEEIMRVVLVFFLLYLMVFALCLLIVVSLGADMITGVTGTIACLGNIGPGFNLVGPMSHYAHLHPISKLVLTAAMWIGRLEVLTVLTILRPEVWRTARWRGRSQLAAAAMQPPPSVPEHRR